MLYWALDKPHCKHGQALQSLAGVIWQPTWLQPYFQVYKLDRWFVEFISYKRWLWQFQSSISLCCSYTPVASSRLLFLPALTPSLFLPPAAWVLHLPLLPQPAWLLLTTFIRAPFCLFRSLFSYYPTMVPVEGIVLEPVLCHILSEVLPLTTPLPHLGIWDAFWLI